jgi:MFS superfamily sulfate permease-like transporter
MILLGGRPVPMPQMLLVWLAPIYLAMAWDWYTRRIVHPVYLIGIAVMVAMRLAIPLRDSDAWLTFCRWLAQPG